MDPSTLTQWRQAADAGDIDALDAIVALHPESIGWDDGYALRRATYFNHNGAAAWLLLKGADVHVRDDEPLRNAMYRRNLDIARLLLEHGADINAHNGDTLDAQINADSVSIDAVRFLLEEGADVVEKNMFDAAFHGNIEVLETLRVHGASFTRGDVLDAQINHAFPVSMAAVRFLLEHGAVVSDKNIRDAVLRGNIDVLKALHEHGANFTHDHLLGAVRKGNPEVLVFLAGAGVDVTTNGHEAMVVAWRESPMCAKVIRRFTGLKYPVAELKALAEALDAKSGVA